MNLFHRFSRSPTGLIAPWLLVLLAGCGGGLDPILGSPGAGMRPTVTATTGGAANPAVSLTEDLLAATISVIAVVLPVLLSAVIILVTAFIIWWLWRRSVRAPRFWWRTAAAPTTPATCF